MTLLDEAINGVCRSLSEVKRSISQLRDNIQRIVEDGSWTMESGSSSELYTHLDELGDMLDILQPCESAITGREEAIELVAVMISDLRSG